MGDAGGQGRGRGSVRPDLAARLAPVLEPAGFDLETVNVLRAGSRSVVRVVVDRDGGVDLDAVAEATRLVSGSLDADDEPVAGPYVLEVTSPGVDRPLVAARHWRRARGRLVAVTTTDGGRLVGRVRAAGEESATLLPTAPGPARPARSGRSVTRHPAPVDVRYADVAHAVVEVEFGPVPDLDVPDLDDVSGLEDPSDLDVDLDADDADDAEDREDPEHPEDTDAAHDADGAEVHR